MDEEKPIWECRQSDTTKSWEAFVIYRDMGPSRSLQKAVDKRHGKSTAKVRQLERWSSRHDWVKRCQAYDDYEYERYQDRKKQKQVEVEQNAWATYQFVQTTIEQEIKNAIDSEEGIDTGKAHEILGLARRADDFARRIVGLPDRISETKTDITSAGKAIPIAIVKMDLDAL